MPTYPSPRPAPARAQAGSPALGRPSPLVEPLWLEWLALGGLLAFGSWLLGVRGVWALLLSADPTGLTLVIVVVFFTATLWCGARSRVLQQQRALLPQALAGGSQGWAADYLLGLRALAAGAPDADAPAERLAEHTHGPHGTAWWVNGIQLKLGLLGKVIGFSVLALQIGRLQNFDPAQSQELLKSLTSGLGIALLTTMVGLVGNILLGLQLTRLDRYADALAADIQHAGLQLTAGATTAKPTAAAASPAAGPGPDRGPDNGPDQGPGASTDARAAGAAPAPGAG